jgi:hypothetical protein
MQQLLLRRFLSFDFGVAKLPKRFKMHARYYMTRDVPALC